MPVNPRIRLPRLLRRVVLVTVACTVLLAGCAGYYLQAAAGQLALMRSRVPLEQVLADPGTPAELRRQLLVVDDALVYARAELGLGQPGSYRQYADLRRPSVVWNVFAAPEFSLEPKEWCYPVAGCAAYRGWFSEQRARESAAELAARGNDVFVGGVAAYSTLGWFDDPVLSTMLGDDDPALAGVLFHELAHQRLYVPGDTLFNEGFATLVEQEGTRRWLEARRDQAGLCRFALREARRTVALGIIARLRGELEAIYADTTARDDERRARREAAFAAARATYAAERAGWTSPPWFDAWFAPGLNNARLAALASYEDYVPGFRSLLAEAGGDLPAFYARVEALGRETPEVRAAVLRRSPGLSESAAAGYGCRAGR